MRGRRTGGRCASSSIEQFAGQGSGRALFSLAGREEPASVHLHVSVLVENRLVDELVAEVELRRRHPGDVRRRVRAGQRGSDPEADGIDERAVIPLSAPAKSYGHQQTFDADLTDEDYAEAILRRMADDLMAKVESARRRIAAINPEVRVEAHRLRLSADNALDLVSRYGGEEFVIVMPQTTLAGATAFADL